MVTYFEAYPYHQRPYQGANSNASISNSYEVAYSALACADSGTDDDSFCPYDWAYYRWFNMEPNKSTPNTAYSTHTSNCCSTNSS
jgi:hypothetical protein